MKLELLGIFDSEENNYLIVGYRSQVISELSVSLKILFESDTVDVPVDSGYGDNETHTSEEREVYIAHDFIIESVTDEDGDEEVVLDSSDTDKIFKEAQVYYNTNLDKEEYGDLVYSFHKALKYAKGGGVKNIEFFSNPQRFITYKGQFLYPPRIEHKLQPISLSKFDNKEYVGQPKLNGSNTSVTISENSAVAKERHNTFFSIPPKFNFTSLHRGKGFMCLTGEYMNKSKKDQSNKPFRGFCIWDIVAYNGKILIGSTIEERINLLNELYPSKESITTDGIEYLFKTTVPDIYKVNNFYGKFNTLFSKLSKVDMIEGFVLKRKSGRLEMMSREQNNTGWAVKVRKPTANYIF